MSEVKTGEEVVRDFKKWYPYNDNDCGLIVDYLKTDLNGMFIVSKKKWNELQNDLLAYKESCRTTLIDYEKGIEKLQRMEHTLQGIKTLMETRLNELKENLKLYNPSEPIYSKICGELEAYKELRKAME